MSNSTIEIINRIRHIKIRANRLAEDILAGSYHSAFKGKGMEFEEVREYVPGDEIRSIDWNVTARMQHPYVKLFREEREISLVLLIDVSSSTQFGSFNGLKKDYIAELAAVLAFSAAKNSDKVGAIFFSDKVEKIIPAKKGFSNVMHILDHAMILKGHCIRSDLSPALKSFGTLFPRKSICIILSDFLYPLEQNLLSLTALKHDLIGMIVADQKELHFPLSNAVIEIQSLESGKRYLADEQRMKEFSEGILQNQNKQQEILIKSGASVVKFNTSRPYLSALKTLFRMRARKK